MIHLDTNILILLPELIQRDHPVVDRVLEGEEVAASAPVWYEYLIGPVEDSDIRLAQAFIGNRVIPAQPEDAALAADLFNRAGRKRALKTDALIAACAIRDDAELLSFNAKDFAPFVGEGLKLFAPAS